MFEDDLPFYALCTLVSLYAAIFLWITVHRITDREEHRRFHAIKDRQLANLDSARATDNDRTSQLDDILLTDTAPLRADQLERRDS